MKFKVDGKEYEVDVPRREGCFFEDDEVGGSCPLDKNGNKIQCDNCPFLKENILNNIMK